MTTEMEYVNFMKDSNFRASVFQQDESFFRSIIKVDKGETNFTDEKTTENQALHEINEQQIKKIQELQKKIEELEDENNALEQEHLVMLKKDSNKEQSTMIDEDSAQVIASKTQQIDLLSNMLEQKGNQLRKAKEDQDEVVGKAKEKDILIEKTTIENQELKVKISQLQKIINSDNNSKAVYNAELMIENSKQMKIKIEQLHKQSMLKDQEISHLQGRQAEYEKRLVLLQQQSKDNKLLQRM